MSDWFYKAEPRNLTTADVDERIRNFATAPSSFGSYAPRVIPFEAVNRPLVTTLPLQPADGDEVRFLADATAGVVWLLRYRKAAQSLYRWEFLGGPGLQETVATSQSTSSTSYTNLATTGPAITAPLSGDYDIHYGGRVIAASGELAMMSVQFSSTAAADADGAWLGGSASTVDGHPHRILRKTIAESYAVTMKYRSSGGASQTFADRFMFITPVRVGRA